MARFRDSNTCEDWRFSPRCMGFVRRLMRGAIVPVAALFVLACDAIENTMTTPPPESKLEVAADIEQRGPIEIAVLPIRRPLNFGEAEGTELLNEVYAELLRKNYTPLDPDYVQKKLPKSYSADGLPDVSTLKSTIAADAYLLVDLHKADIENEEGMRPRYRLDATCWLFHGEDGSTLYKHDLTQTYDVQLDGSKLLPGNQRREKLKFYAGRLLTRLPIRRTR